LIFSAMPGKQGLYDPETEQDSCGVAMVADIRGRRSHGIVTDGLAALTNLDHRGAAGAEPTSGDGAGILLQLPDALLRAEAGFELPAPDERGRHTYAAGIAFLPQDAEQRRKAVELAERIAVEEGLEVLGWREVPVDADRADIGPTARSVMPHFAMLFVTGESDSAQLTVCDASGVATLPLNAASLALIGSAPLDTAVASAEPAVAAQAEALLGQRLPIAQQAERWLQAARAPWDLAQFDLASSGRARAGKKFSAWLQALRHAPQWRAARWGAVVLVLAQLVGLNAWAWKERNALDTKRSTINAMLTQTFPSVKLVVDAPLQMAREVAALQQSTGGVASLDLEPMLAVLGASLPPGRVPTALDYSAGQLRLRGLNLSATEIASLTSTMAARGYTVRGEGDFLLVQAEAGK